MISIFLGGVQMGRKKQTTIKKYKRSLIFGKNNLEKATNIMTLRKTIRIFRLMILVRKAKNN
jgi:hypothetical protein